MQEGSQDVFTYLENFFSCRHWAQRRFSKQNLNKISFDTGENVLQCKGLKLPLMFG